MTRTHLYNATWMFCIAILLTACSHPKAYERHKEVAYTKEGVARTDGYFINAPFLDALDADLQACYAKKAP